MDIILLFLATVEYASGVMPLRIAADMQLATGLSLIGVATNSSVSLYGHCKGTAAVKVLIWVLSQAPERDDAVSAVWGWIRMHLAVGLLEHWVRLDDSSQVIVQYRLSHLLLHDTIVSK